MIVDLVIAGNGDARVIVCGPPAPIWNPITCGPTEASAFARVIASRKVHGAMGCATGVQSGPVVSPSPGSLTWKPVAKEGDANASAPKAATTPIQTLRRVPPRLIFSLTPLLSRSAGPCTDHQ
jgi:hypothetical protein